MGGRGPELRTGGTEGHSGRSANADEWLLPQLVRLAEGGQDFEITIMAGGETVTGILASQKQYLEFLRSTLHQKIDTSDAVREALDQIFKCAEGMLLEETHDERPATHLHIKEAQLVRRHGVAPSQEPMWWRVKVDSVDGFWLGRLTDSAE